MTNCTGIYIDGQEAIQIELLEQRFLPFFATIETTEQDTFN